MSTNSVTAQTEEVIQPDPSRTYNLTSYEKKRQTFSWDEAVKGLGAASSGKWNAAYECIDRHVEEGFAEKTALLFTDGEKEESYTFGEVKTITDSYARVLKSGGVAKGSRVFIFLPKSPDCYFTILAAIKAGAIAGPLFEAFKEDAVRERMEDCEAEFLITDSELGKRVPEKDIPSLRKTWEITSLREEACGFADEEDPTVWLGEEDGMLIHYTSGSTGKPKGVLHVQRAISHQYISGKWVLDVHEDDVYWCTSHPGWVTGSVYGVFAPWLNRATVVIHGGRFDADEWYSLIERFKVTIWYSAPTAFRMLMSKGNLFENYNLSSLRHILSVGEPLNPEVIHWAGQNFGVRIHDTWWMTETGAHLIVNLPSEAVKPGSMGRPLPGIEVAILDETGEPLPAGETGELAVKAPWPGLMKTIWKNEQKFRSYFTEDSWYLSGDTAYRDEDGYIFFSGRNDDLINTAGERVGPFEVESRLIEHPAVAEAGVIGKPDPVRGEIIKAFITLREGFTDSSNLRESVRFFVREGLSAHAAPREIEVVEELPKTKISGKILRRVLKAGELSKYKEASQV
ncbi:acetate--CoA ligase [Alteribacter natronophilus]|uniref:acetate--CoA ligase n=1 Tax=Alteribacter natronophilus TaxID=2583810 RepID=UPI00110DF9AC|nr:acetate--CoA ligase [Alteribacter natronophilus]TMW71816.1 acetate--CoA ligase [Alteribacter natronophilus]